LQQEEAHPFGVTAATVLDGVGSQHVRRKGGKLFDQPRVNLPAFSQGLAQGRQGLCPLCEAIEDLFADAGHGLQQQAAGSGYFAVVVQKNREMNGGGKLFGDQVIMGDLSGDIAGLQGGAGAERLPTLFQVPGYGEGTVSPQGIKMVDGVEGGKGGGQGNRNLFEIAPRLARGGGLRDQPLIGPEQSMRKLISSWPFNEEAMSEVAINACPRIRVSKAPSAWRCRISRTKGVPSRIAPRTVFSASKNECNKPVLEVDFIVQSVVTIQ